ncbi:MAG: thioredoxin family protein [Planctomycetia bacterium]|nr:thioredoxin family protein [Planctomycetia bacterium]
MNSAQLFASAILVTLCTALLAQCAYAETESTPSAATTKANPKISTPNTLFWHEDIYAAMKLARETKRPILLHFYTTSCTPCRRMEQEVLTQEEIQKLAATYYIAVKINGSEQPDIARRFYVNAYPTDFILTHEGKLVGHLRGLQTQIAYRSFLLDTAKRMEFSPRGDEEKVASAAEIPSRQVSSSTQDVSGDAIVEILDESRPTPEVAQEAFVPPFVGDDVDSRPGQESTMSGTFVRTSAHPNASGSLSVSKTPLLLDGYCVVTMVEQNMWVKGNVRYGIRHAGGLYLFQNEESMNKFYSNPDHYALVLGGMDAVLLSETHEKKPGSRVFGVRYDNMNFVFSDAQTRELFRKNPEKYARPIRESLVETAKMRQNESR